MRYDVDSFAGTMTRCVVCGIPIEEQVDDEFDPAPQCQHCNAAVCDAFEAGVIAGGRR